MNEKPKHIKTLNCHGVNAVSPSEGSDWVGDCVFCNKAGHFYVSPEEGLWDCKVCGKSGNVYSFLKQLVETRKVPPSSEWKRLLDSRKLPGKILEARNVKWHKNKWLIPVYAETGSVRDIRCYDYQQMMVTAGCEAQLYGMRELAKAKPGARVHLCEGEWDAMAMDWLLDASGIKDDIVVAVPGANTFKASWVPMFKGKKVICYYDNDNAGDQGAERAKKLLSGTAKELSFCNWPDSHEQGYDLRDFVVDKLTNGNETSDIWNELGTLIETAPRRDPSRKPSGIAPANRSSFQDTLITMPIVLDTFKKKMSLTEDLEAALRISLAISVSNDIQGDPLWIYIIGPPGCGKTLILSALADSERCIFRSTLTPHCLVSGWQGSGADPSLIPKLVGKTLVAKDFTEILSMHKTAQDEIFSTLRGAYDGQVIKTFGNGVERTYDDCRFSMIAGVTNAIHAHRSASLGERFLKLQVRPMEGESADSVIQTAMGSIGQEKEKETELRDVVTAFLVRKIEIKTLPRLTDAQTKRLIALVQLIAVMRAVVERDTRTQDLLYRPVPEAGTRLAKQLARLAMCLAALEEGATVVDEKSFILTERVAKDTAHGFYFDVIEAAMVTGQGTFTKPDIVKHTKLPASTIHRQIEDLELLEVIKRTQQVKDVGPKGGTPPVIFEINKRIANLWYASQGMTPCQTQTKPKLGKIMLKRSKSI